MGPHPLRHRYTLVCETPPLDSMLCDGRVLVEASADSAAWTSDEVELQLTSTVDTKKLRLKGPTVGPVGTPIQLLLHTFDHRNRRRSTGGDKFTCALRNHAPLPEEAGQDVPLLTAEQPALDNNNGTHLLTFQYEKAGDFYFSVRLDGVIVTELSITLEACATNAQTCDLQVTPSSRGGAVTLSAGGTLAFSVVPRDKFGNGCAHREDAHVSLFAWQLQKLPPPKPKDDDDDKPPPPPPPVAPVVTFTSLESTSKDITEAGEYTLTVYHNSDDGMKMVQGKPTHVTVLPGPMEPECCTLHGSGMHHAWVEGLQVRLI
jgi:hypothetical protein